MAFFFSHSGLLDISPIAFRLDFNFGLNALYLVPILLFHQLFDAVATVLVLLRHAYFSSSKIDLGHEEIDRNLASSRKVKEC